MALKNKISSLKTKISTKVTNIYHKTAENSMEAFDVKTETPVPTSKHGHKERNHSEQAKKEKSWIKTNLLKIKKRKNFHLSKELRNKNIFNLFFYTDVKNIPLILEQGITSIKTLSLKKQEEFVVWSYLQHEDYVDLELGNSTRQHFWRWCASNKINLEQIAVISINLEKLFYNTSKEWFLKHELENKLSVYETIPIVSFDFILIKDQKMYRWAKMYSENQNLHLSIVQGEYGNLTSE